MDNRRQISSFLINPSFQGKFLAIFAFFGFFQALVNYYVIYWSFKQIQEAVVSSGEAVSQTIVDLVIMQEFYVMTFIGSAFLISFLVFIFVGVRFTHKAAGALYRMKVEFEKMQQAKALHTIKLREGDYFREVEDAFNSLAESMDEPKKTNKDS